jgi:hypothetical protein
LASSVAIKAPGALGVSSQAFGTVEKLALGFKTAAIIESNPDPRLVKLPTPVIQTA